MLVIENVKYYAEKRGLTIQELEAKAKVGNGTIGKWSEKNRPTLKTIEKLAVALNVSPKTLLFGKPR